MPSKEKTYDRVIFTPEIIKAAENSMVMSLNSSEKDSKRKGHRLTIQISEKEQWSHDEEEEFFADYVKGFKYALFESTYTNGHIEIWVWSNSYTRVSVFMQTRADVEKVFNVFEANVDKCCLPQQPRDESKAETDWVNETIEKIETHCPVAARKVRLAKLKLGSEDKEEWQNATMLIRDAWIELLQWLCQANNIDTSDIPPDSVVDRLRKLKIHTTDERLFNLARASFSLYGKHHNRDIELDTAIACVISSVVSMKTVIREAFNATG